MNQVVEQLFYHCRYSINCPLSIFLIFIELSLIISVKTRKQRENVERTKKIEKNTNKLRNKTLKFYSLLKLILKHTRKQS